MLPLHRFLCISIHFPTFTSTSRQKNPGVLGLGTSHSAFAPRGVGNEVKGAALNPKAGVVTWSRAGFAMLDCVEIRDTPSSRRFAIVAANDCLNADAYAGRIAAEIVLASVAGILDAFQNVIVALSEKAAPRSRTLVFVHERSLARCTAEVRRRTVSRYRVGSAAARPVGARSRRTGASRPWQNPYAERLIGSIRRECLDHVIVLGERHLRQILTGYFVIMA